MNDAFYLLIGICGFVFGTIAITYDNLEYKGYSSAHSCTGDCYVKYVEENGTPAQIEQKKRAAAESDPFSSIKGLWAGCAACHGQEGQGMGVFPKLAGRDASYISEKLYAYKNREEVGSMSSTMWAQAGMLSDGDIDTISKFIEETMK
jgi:cytochrome c553|tara:strand:- start:164 stop:607 length:444 start_codon:yes stop_codon:yes gene_type:complete